VSLNRKVDPNIVFTHAKGSRIFDADGNEYIDFHAAFSPHLLGHNHPTINEAVCKAMDEEWSLMGSGVTPWEARLAELLCEVIPSVETVQITNTGSEANAHAITLSRAWTGRDHIILMLGGYNGWHNDVARAVMPTLEEIGPRLSAGEYPFLPLSAGIPETTTKHLHIVNFNDIESVEYVMKKYPIACVLTEPVLQNIGVLPPQEGYLASLQKICAEYGTLLVFDEVKTGFRSALGGYQSIAGVMPDLSVFGKAVANGYPLGVIGGRREIMDLFADPDPSRRVLIAGTYNAHPMSTAAAIATIEILHDASVYKQLEDLGSRLQAGLEDLFSEKGMTATVSRIGSAFCVYFCDHVPTDWHDVLENHDFDLDRRYRRLLIEHGIYHFPLACKQGSISAVHTEEDIAKTLEITHDILKRI